MMRLPHLLIKNTINRGRGIFTSTPISPYTIVEIAPVIVMSATDRLYLDKTLLHDYIFEWQPEDQPNQCIMALGWIPIYNHNCPSNCEYFMDYDKNEIIIQTIRAIQAGEELTINYNGDFDNDQKVWFNAE